MNLQSGGRPSARDEINFFDYWRVIVKRKRLISTIFLIPLTAAVIINVLMPKIYRGEAVLAVNTNVITPKELAGIIGDRKDLVFTKSSGSVAAFQLVEVQGANDKLRVIIDSRNSENIQDHFAEFAQYLRNSPVIKERADMEVERLKRQIVDLSAVVNLQHEFLNYCIKLMRNGKLSDLYFNPADLKQKSMDLDGQRFLLEKSLKNFTPFYMSYGNISRRIIKPKIKENVILTGISSLFLGVLLSFFMESSFIRQRKEH